MAIATAKEAIDTANDALNLYNKVLDQIVPWNGFKEMIKKYDMGGADYSHESANLIGKIKTQLLNVKDEYDSATQTIYEWCGISINLLKTYINLFNGGDASKQTVQKKFVANVLDNGMKKIQKAQEKLDDVIVYLNKTSEHLTALGNRLYNDYDENSEYFRHRKERIVRQSHQAAEEKSGPTGATGIASTLIEEKLLRELKERLNSIREFNENLKTTVDQALIDAKQTKEKLDAKMQRMNELKTRVAESEPYALDDHVAELRNSAIQSAENLIANCNDYRNNHAL